MVFAPGVRLTVTVERPADEAELHVHAGGQGVWQARMVALLGGEATLCTTLGGETGRVLATLLESEDFGVRAVHLAETSGWYVHDRRDGERDEIASHPGAPLDRHHVDELYTAALAEGLRTTVSVLGGPVDPAQIPADAYRRLAADLTTNGAELVVDLLGEHLDAVLPAGVALAKVSHDELVETGRARDDSPASLARVAGELHDAGASAVLVTRADEPAIALIDEEYYLVSVPPMEEADFRGAGDSLVGAVAAMLAQGADLPTAVRTGAAAGAANVTRHGLGTGHADVIMELARRVTLDRWSSFDRRSS